MDINHLKEYLRKIYELECFHYNQGVIINELKEKATKVEQSFQKEELLRPRQLSEFSGLNFNYVLMSSLVFTILCCFLIGLKRGLPLSLLLTFIAIIACAIFSPIYQKSCFEDYNDTVKRKNKRLVQSNIESEANAKEKSLIILSEVDEIKKIQQETKRILDLYYEFDIIFPKYRNLVAISSILEYFESGRCTTLEGHEGAYNIFESELRQNIIISKLDDVVNNLEDIKTNQYLLYNAVKQNQATNMHIMNTVSHLASTMNHISSNSDVIAYNTEQIAKNTEYANWLATHEYYKSPTF